MGYRVAVAGKFCENCPFIEPGVELDKNEKGEVTGWTFKCKKISICQRIHEFILAKEKDLPYESPDQKLQKELDNLKKSFDPSFSVFGGRK